METVVDTLVCKAILFAIESVFKTRHLRLPITISVTLNQFGKILSGQDITSFYNSIKHINPLSVGINCSFGASHILPYLKELSDIADCYVHAYPNAGLPNNFGEYEEGPKLMAEKLLQFFKLGLVNIIGGCCGTTPEHIKNIAKFRDNFSPRKLQKAKP